MPRKYKQAVICEQAWASIQLHSLTHKHTRKARLHMCNTATECVQEMHEPTDKSEIRYLQKNQQMFDST